MSFARLVHCDWSIHDAKRWKAEAECRGGIWCIVSIDPVGPLAAFVGALVHMSESTRTLAGFDFPIGVPAAYGRRSGARDFPAFLDQLGHGRWAGFYEPATRPEEIALERPLYPRRPGGTTQRHLLAALGVEGIDALRRGCERAVTDRPAAASLFWTLGPNQVGRAAVAGWRDVVKPARAHGAALWPFDGTLESLADRALVLAETYPAEAYRIVGARFPPCASKRRQSDRASRAPAILAWTRARGIGIEPKLLHDIGNGFGPDTDGEDRFDALLGLLAMIAADIGAVPESPGGGAAADLAWEGSILGLRS